MNEAKEVNNMCGCYQAPIVSEFCDCVCHRQGAVIVRTNHRNVLMATIDCSVPPPPDPARDIFNRIMWPE